MGLDITAFKGLEKLAAPDQKFETDLYVNPDFTGRADEIESGAHYGFEDSIEGWSGPYGAYNRWREKLAKLAGYPEFNGSHAASCWADTAPAPITEGPFYELIDFADNEGTLGAAVCAKLAKDFAEWDERAQAIGGDWYEAYVEWRRCFEFASDRGAVKFH